MMGRTHALLGISTLWLLSPLPPEMVGCNMGVLAAVAALGALLPDLDASESQIKHLKILGTPIKPFLLPAQIVHRSDQHRGLMHSFAGLGMVAIFVFPLLSWVGWAPAVSLLLGYASHLLSDSATKSGLMLFYPRRKRFYLLPHGWRITTGLAVEEIVLALFATIDIVFLLSRLAVHLPSSTL